MNLETIASFLFLIFLSFVLIRLRKELQVQRVADLKTLGFYAVLITGLVKFSRGGFSTFNPIPFTVDFWFTVGVVVYVVAIFVEKVYKRVLPGMYFALHKTTFGLKKMDAIATSYPKLVSAFGTTGFVVGIAGMLYISYTLIKNLIFPTPAGSVGLVLPFKVAGGFYVPFFYWILSIFVIAIIHEFSHGVVARVHKTPVKSSGFAFFGMLVPIIPAAFVEPDDKILNKKSLKQKLSVFAAGPFSNIVSAAIFLGLFLLLSMFIASSVVDFKGYAISEKMNGSLSDIPLNTTITTIEGVELLSVENLTYALQNKAPGDVVTLASENTSYQVTLTTHPLNASKGYLGLNFEPVSEVKPTFKERYGQFTADATLWVFGLLYWLFALSLGIGMFNLVPIGPVDGGQMLREILKKYIKDEQKALKVFGYISMFFLLIIIISIFTGFV